MKIYRDIEQGTKEWEALRIASIGGSSIGDAVAGGGGKVRKTLMCNFIQEIITGEKTDHFVSWDMKEGIKHEPAARFAYEMRTGVDVEQVALVKHSEHKHDSPDGLVDENGMIEIKRRILSVFLDFIEKPTIPTGDRKQMQWGMYVCEREWCDYVLYCPYIELKADPLIIVRVKRDEAEISELTCGADEFIKDMQTLLLRVLKRR